MEKILHGKNSRYRRGTCAWCKRGPVQLIYTVYVTDGAYHAARVCERCLMELKERIRKNDWA